MSGGPVTSILRAGKHGREAVNLATLFGDPLGDFLYISSVSDMDPSEVEFLAEKEKISILTNFSENKIFLIGVLFF